MSASNLAVDYSKEKKVLDSALFLLSAEPIIMAEKAKRSLYFFVKEFWDAVVQDPFLDNWHIPFLCKELEYVFWNVYNRVPRPYDLIINIPPGTTKSTIMTKMFPAWAWITAPWMSFITGSYKAELSLEHADVTRDIIHHPKFQQYYPGRRLRPDLNAKGEYQIQHRLTGKYHHRPWNDGGKRYSTSVGGGVTGMHGHIILVDDPLNPKQAEAMSGADRNEANRWMDRTLSTRKTDKAVTPTILIMQRLHQDDPTGHLMKKGTPIRHINLPGEMLPGHPRIKIKPEGLEKFYVNGLLDPRRLSRVVLDEMKKTLGNYGYSSQILQDPIPPQGGMFKPESLKILTHAPSFASAEQACWYWDKAGTAGGGAWTVGTLMLKMRQPVSPRFIIAKIVRGQWESDRREIIIKEEAMISGRSVSVVVEQEPGSGGKESAQATIKNLAGYRCFADRPTGDKALRADPFSVQVNVGNVGIVNGPWLEPFLEEMRFFPFSQFKDQIDSASGAFNYLNRAKRVGAW